LAVLVADGSVRRSCFTPVARRRSLTTSVPSAATNVSASHDHDAQTVGRPPDQAIFRLLIDIGGRLGEIAA
jgi:hypothetical protein